MPLLPKPRVFLQYTKMPGAERTIFWVFLESQVGQVTGLSLSAIGRVISKTSSQSLHLKS